MPRGMATSTKVVSATTRVAHRMPREYQEIKTHEKQSRWNSERRRNRHPSVLSLPLKLLLLLLVASLPGTSATVCKNVHGSPHFKAPGMIIVDCPPGGIPPLSGDPGRRTVRNLLRNSVSTYTSCPLVPAHARTGGDSPSVPREAEAAARRATEDGAFRHTYRRVRNVETNATCLLCAQEEFLSSNAPEQRRVKGLLGSRYVLENVTDIVSSTLPGLVFTEPSGRRALSPKNPEDAETYAQVGTRAATPADQLFAMNTVGVRQKTFTTRSDPEVQGCFRMSLSDAIPRDGTSVTTGSAWTGAHDYNALGKSHVNARPTFAGDGGTSWFWKSSPDDGTPFEGIYKAYTPRMMQDVCHWADHEEYADVNNYRPADIWTIATYMFDYTSELYIPNGLWDNATYEEVAWNVFNKANATFFEAWARNARTEKKFRTAEYDWMTDWKTARPNLWTEVPRSTPTHPLFGLYFLPGAIENMARLVTGSETRGSHWMVSLGRMFYRAADLVRFSAGGESSRSIKENFNYHKARKSKLFFPDTCFFPKTWRLDWKQFGYCFKPQVPVVTDERHQSHEIHLERERPWLIMYPVAQNMLAHRFLFPSAPVCTDPVAEDGLTEQDRIIAQSAHCCTKAGSKRRAVTCASTEDAALRFSPHEPHEYMFHKAFEDVPLTSETPERDPDARYATCRGLLKKGNVLKMDGTGTGNNAYLNTHNPSHVGFTTSRIGIRFASLAAQFHLVLTHIRSFVLEATDADACLDAGSTRHPFFNPFPADGACGRVSQKFINPLQMKHVFHNTRYRRRYAVDKEGTDPHSSLRNETMDPAYPFKLGDTDMMFDSGDFLWGKSAHVFPGIPTRPSPCWHLYNHTMHATVEDLNLWLDGLDGLEEKDGTSTLHGSKGHLFAGRLVPDEWDGVGGGFLGENNCTVARLIRFVRDTPGLNQTVLKEMARNANLFAINAVARTAEAAEVPGNPEGLIGYSPEYLEAVRTTMGDILDVFHGRVNWPWIVKELKASGIEWEYKLGYHKSHPDAILDDHFVGVDKALGIFVKRDIFWEASDRAHAQNVEELRSEGLWTEEDDRKRKEWEPRWYGNRFSPSETRRKAQFSRLDTAARHRVVEPPLGDTIAAHLADTGYTIPQDEGPSDPLSFRFGTPVSHVDMGRATTDSAGTFVSSDRLKAFGWVRAVQVLFSHAQTHFSRIIGALNAAAAEDADLTYQNPVTGPNLILYIRLHEDANSKRVQQYVAERSHLGVRVTGPPIGPSHAMVLNAQEIDCHDTGVTSAFTNARLQCIGHDGFTPIDSSGTYGVKVAVTKTAILPYGRMGLYTHDPQTGEPFFPDFPASKHAGLGHGDWDEGTSFPWWRQGPLDPAGTDRKWRQVPDTKTRFTTQARTRLGECVPSDMNVLLELLSGIGGMRPVSEKGKRACLREFASRKADGRNKRFVNAYLRIPITDVPKGLTGRFDLPLDVQRFIRDAEESRGSSWFDPVYVVHGTTDAETPFAGETWSSSSSSTPVGGASFVLRIEEISGVDGIVTFGYYMFREGLRDNDDDDTMTATEAGETVSALRSEKTITRDFENQLEDIRTTLKTTKEVLVEGDEHARCTHAFDWRPEPHMALVDFFEGDMMEAERAYTALVSSGVITDASTVFHTCASVDKSYSCGLASSSKFPNGIAGVFSGRCAPGVASYNSSWVRCMDTDDIDAYLKCVRELEKCWVGPSIYGSLFGELVDFEAPGCTLDASESRQCVPRDPTTVGRTMLPTGLASSAVAVAALDTDTGDVRCMLGWGGPECSTRCGDFTGVIGINAEPPYYPCTSGAPSSTTCTAEFLEGSSWDTERGRAAKVCGPGSCDLEAKKCVCPPHVKGEFCEKCEAGRFDLDGGCLKSCTSSVSTSTGSTFLDLGDAPQYKIFMDDVGKTHDQACDALGLPAAARVKVSECKFYDTVPTPAYLVDTLNQCPLHFACWSAFTESVPIPKFVPSAEWCASETEGRCSISEDGLFVTWITFATGTPWFYDEAVEGGDTSAPVQHVSRNGTLYLDVARWKPSTGALSQFSSRNVDIGASIRLNLVAAASIEARAVEQVCGGAERSETCDPLADDDCLLNTLPCEVSDVATAASVCKAGMNDICHDNSPFLLRQTALELGEVLNAALLCQAFWRAYCLREATTGVITRTYFTTDAYFGKKQQEAGRVAEQVVPPPPEKLDTFVAASIASWMGIATANPMVLDRNTMRLNMWSFVHRVATALFIKAAAVMANTEACSADASCHAMDEGCVTSFVDLCTAPSSSLVMWAVTESGVIDPCDFNCPADNVACLIMRTYLANGKCPKNDGGTLNTGSSSGDDSVPLTSQTTTDYCYCGTETGCRCKAGSNLDAREGCMECLPGAVWSDPPFNTRCEFVVGCGVDLGCNGHGSCIQREVDTGKSAIATALHPNPLESTDVTWSCLCDLGFTGKTCASPFRPCTHGDFACRSSLPFWTPESAACKTRDLAVAPNGATHVLNVPVTSSIEQQSHLQCQRIGGTLLAAERLTNIGDLFARFIESLVPSTPGLVSSARTACIGAIARDGTFALHRLPLQGAMVKAPATFQCSFIGPPVCIVDTCNNPASSTGAFV